MAEQDPISDSTLDALAAELGAMQVIAKALSEIRDRETRLRVLTWACERFTMLPPVVTPPAPASAAAGKPLDTDPTLEVDSLSEFFERPQSTTELLALQAAGVEQEEVEPSAASRTRRGRALDILVRGVSRGLALLGAEWQTA